jgi:hypothetical protein
MLVGSEIEMAKKMGLFDDLLRNIMLIAIGYTAYGGITLSSSPNLFKELQGSWLIFLTLSFSDLLVLDTIYYMSKKGAHGTVRPPKAGTTIKRIISFTTPVLVPLTIVLTVFVAIYFFVVFIASTYMLTLSRSLMLYMIFITTALMYFATMYYDIKVWHYKQVHKPTRTAQRYRKTLTKPAL